MKMVGHQAVAEERERIPCLGAGEIAKEHIPFAVRAEDGPTTEFQVHNKGRKGTETHAQQSWTTWI
ncbi:MAG: hypothetical protein ACXVBB_17730, partial [Isosphaeraceae bacterium]